MKITTSYGATFRGATTEDLVRTESIYNDAVTFFVHVCDKEWGSVSNAGLGNKKNNMVERLTVITKKRPVVPYPFREANKGFIMMPSSVRRAAISKAIGIVRSYRSNIANWEADDPKTRESKPTLPTKVKHTDLTFFQGGSNAIFKKTGTYTARIKIFTHNTWDWVDITFRKSDIDYLSRNCCDRDISSPTLEKRGRRWRMRFACEEKATLNDQPVSDRRILAVDLGINNACTCVVMTADGAIHGRHFLKLSAEEDSLRKAIGRITKVWKNGARHMPGLWQLAKGINDDIAVKTANFIIEAAIVSEADVIVFEHLDTQKRKRGRSKRQRLHLWNHQYVQAMVTDKAHRAGMRISHICAWGTSKLAFDGSGTVVRGIDNNYSTCRFMTGKIYNCDLNASYNIGARYFVREITKSVPVTDRQRLEAKVPSAVKRTTCTLSTLISLNAELTASAA